MQKIRILLAAIVLVLSGYGALAGNVLSVTIGTPGAGGGDPLYTAFGKINTAVNGVANCWAATTAPSFSGSPETYQCWWNTTGAPTAVVLNFFDGTSWAPAGTLNATAHTFTPQGGATCTGDMTGTFPACTLLTSVNSNVGSYGGVNSIPVVTVNNKGQVTAVSVATPAIPFTEVTGTASCAQLPALTGNVTSSACATTIAAGAVTLARQANLAANTIIGNNTGSPATPLALTPANVLSLIGAVSDITKQMFTSSGTYTPHAGLLFADVTCVGPGGGSGGVATAIAAATGGASTGGISRTILTAAQIAADGGTETITLGTVGAAGTGAPTGGGNATQTSVGARCIALGGIGSAANSTASTGGGAALAPSAGTGQDVFPGATGNPGIAPGAAPQLVIGGLGGQSIYGASSYTQCTYGSVTGQAAGVGSGYGAGASGSVNCGHTGGIVGTAGQPGYVSITEYSSQ